MLVLENDDHVVGATSPVTGLLMGGAGCDRGSRAVGPLRSSDPMRRGGRYRTCLCKDFGAEELCPTRVWYIVSLRTGGARRTGHVLESRLLLVVGK